MTKQIPVRSAREYQTRNGKSPFKEWLQGTPDARAQAKITKAIMQMELGNYGYSKFIVNGNGLGERRLDYGPGYRIYYVIEENKLIILFAGSKKSDQKKVIGKAKQYLKD